MVINTGWPKSKVAISNGCNFWKRQNVFQKWRIFFSCLFTIPKKKKNPPPLKHILVFTTYCLGSMIMELQPFEIATFDLGHPVLGVGPSPNFQLRAEPSQKVTEPARAELFTSFFCVILTSQRAEPRFLYSNKPNCQFTSQEVTEPSPSRAFWDFFP